ncbi:hypothetical protein RhiXN_01448 [Rhizoctonia solani]|uniref:Uncharacterized protein n=1 Tax=Rhizoctonia solani TaxID=456999 RepID=A0A8H8P8Q3_9AGAM|nr:uncharacterized protein RhiXN_01448 [Rhizoctonia solani]QRW26853.1 hypothetical protein RhiXN_01448 [Rhizoctonia solani]
MALRLWTTSATKKNRGDSSIMYGRGGTAGYKATTPTRIRAFILDTSRSKSGSSYKERRDQVAQAPPPLIPPLPHTDHLLSFVPP